MHITTSESNGHVTLCITGRLDSGTSEEADKWIETFELQKDTSLLIDFSELDYISSAGLRVIFNFARRLKDQGCKFAICSAQDHVREIFEISGFDAFIPLIKTPEDFT
ncbi:STAS domain-containing protein [Desulfogranum japonicum]|uniref:STAS domain-containing protein n=1 Tax=Desulfogranum japonicum TaxID=231447 RepID=UPI0003FD9DDA|nr:STAS domain-containing protein [Desulfogranum japonicum]